MGTTKVKVRTGKGQHQLQRLRCSYRRRSSVQSVRDLAWYSHRQRLIVVDARSVNYKFVQCRAALRQLRKIRPSVPMASFQTLAVSLVNRRLDYSNTVLVGIPTYLITDALYCFSWWAFQSEQFKIAVLSYKVLHGSALRHLGAAQFCRRPTCTWPAGCTLCSHQSSSRAVSPTVNQWPSSVSGCHCLDLEHFIRRHTKLNSIRFQRSFERRTVVLPLT